MARFAADSSLEGDGFEPSVPGRERVSHFREWEPVTEAQEAVL
jgi:hypothetical protein